MGVQGGMGMSPMMPMTTPGFQSAHGFGGATTTSIGAGLPPGGIGPSIASGAITNPAFQGPGMNPGFPMGPNMGMQYPNYPNQYQGRGIFGNCCGGGDNDWCGSNFGSG